jgi:Tfp pilus assembly protein PilF
VQLQTVAFPVRDSVGKQQKALEQLQKKLAARPKDPDLLNDVGWFHYDCGNWAEAERYFRQAVAANPQYKRAWINLGLTLGQQERYPESMDAFLKAVHPAEAECNLAFVYLTQGMRVEARAAYERALKQEPTSQLARAALARLDETGGAPAVLGPPAKPTR